MLKNNELIIIKIQRQMCLLCANWYRESDIQLIDLYKNG